MKGILYGIGVGPGDPELMTIKALRTIEACQIIILPTKKKEECYAFQIAGVMVPSILEKEILCMEFPMRKEKEILSRVHDQISHTIQTHLDDNKILGFLTMGDPSIYATYMYIHERIIKSGRRAKIISGIPSFCAAAAALGVSLGANQEEIHIIPGSYAEEGTLAYPGNKIFMKSGGRLEILKRAIKEKQRTDRLEVYGVSRCGMEGEELFYGVDEIETDSYLTIVIVKEN